jgi:hypothetical protein
MGGFCWIVVAKSEVCQAPLNPQFLQFKNFSVRLCVLRVSVVLSSLSIRIMGPLVGSRVSPSSPTPPPPPLAAQVDRRPLRHVPRQVLCYAIRIRDRHGQQVAVDQCAAKLSTHPF